MKLSIASTLYASVDSLSEFHRSAGNAARLLAGEDDEIVLVNDGSPDHSIDVAIRLSATDHHVMIIDAVPKFRAS